MPGALTFSACSHRSRSVLLTTRRTFLSNAAAVAALAQYPSLLWSQASPQLRFSVNSKQRLATMPPNFTGLSYESAQLGHPEFFSKNNRQLIALMRRLGSQGVLRIGGNTAEYTTWSDDDSDAARNQTPPAIGPDAGTAAKTASILTPLAIRNLNDFVEAVGWRVIYGLNLRHGMPENAAAEAKYVATTLGDKLICFQIGNEPDMNHPEGSKERWTFDYYYPQWQKFQAAVLQAVPHARFAGPDIAKEYSWVTAMAAKKPEIDFLSGHYYAEGPPANPKMTLEYLLRRGNDPATDEIGIVQAATKVLGKPFRMTEGNSCFHGGKPGVSDTVASALWSADYMLQVAQGGYIGVNLHGGGNGLYTPIAGSLEEGFSARPVYYGMLLAERFAGSSFVSTSLSAQSATQNVTGFASSAGQDWKLAIFNKAPEPVSIQIDGLPHGKAEAHVTLMHGLAIDAKEGVTFGGSAVDPDGSFSPQPQLAVTMRRGGGVLPLPAYTAAYIEL
jgi:hypothetical protein